MLAWSWLLGSRWIDRNSSRSWLRALRRSERHCWIATPLRWMRISHRHSKPTTMTPDPKTRPAQPSMRRRLLCWPGPRQCACSGVGGVDSRVVGARSRWPAGVGDRIARLGGECLQSLGQPETAAIIQVTRLHAVALLGQYGEAVTCRLRIPLLRHSGNRSREFAHRQRAADLCRE